MSRPKGSKNKVKISPPLKYSINTWEPDGVWEEHLDDLSWDAIELARQLQQLIYIHREIGHYGDDMYLRRGYNQRVEDIIQLYDKLKDVKDIFI